MSDSLRPEARTFYRAAMAAFDHALTHSLADTDQDSMQLVLSLDYGTEMLLKAVIKNRGESIMKGPKHSLNVLEALKEAGTYAQGSSVEVLRVHRDSLQHFAQYTDPATARDLYEGILLLVDEVHQTDLEIPMPENLRLAPLTIPKLSGVELVAESSNLQRDIQAHDSGVIVWSEGSPSGSELGIYVKKGSDPVSRLSPKDAFEYMPKTNGSEVVCFRQSGGVVHYNLETRHREVLSETGAPTAIDDDWIAAQGLSIEEGLGGGIWLYNKSTKEWEQMSESGDSARLTQGIVTWQELDGSVLTIKRRDVTGGRVHTVVRNGTHPSPWGDHLAWTDVGPTPDLHVVDGTGKEIYRTENATFPFLRDQLVAYLRRENETYSLMLDNVATGSNVLSIPGVGFPIGSGPILTSDSVYFESKTGRDVHAIWRLSVELHP